MYNLHAAVSVSAAATLRRCPALGLTVPMRALDGEWRGDCGEWGVESEVCRGEGEVNATIA